MTGDVAWQSTDCLQPPIPAAASTEAEQVADDLNAQRLIYNGYARQTQIYMNCLSAEAERDAEAMNDITTKSAQALIDAAQHKLEQRAVGPRRDH